MTFWTGSQKSVSSLGPWEPWVYFKNTTFIWWFWRCWRDCEFVGLSDINAEEVCYWAFLFRVFANNLQESSFTTKIMFLTKSDHFIQKNWESKVAHAFLHQPKPLLVCLSVLPCVGLVHHTSCTRNWKRVPRRFKKKIEDVLKYHGFPI